MLNYDIKINYYDILGLEHTATPTEIKKSYRKLALKNHPDKGGDPEEFKKIAGAYELLTDEETKTQYDLERALYSTEATPKSSNTAQGEHFYNNVSPLSQNELVFNTVNSTSLSANTSLVPSSGLKNSASEGLKAETMSDDDLCHLAEKVEQVALAIAKNIDLLKRLHSSTLNSKLWEIAAKHPSFAYQILACRETRHYLYEGAYSFRIESLLKNSYNVLLLIAGSSELTEQFLYKDGVSILNGTQLYGIYQTHLKNRGSCSAFMALLEANPQFNILLQNTQILQSGGTQYELNQLELLDDGELSQLAKKNLSVAAMVINHQTLLSKFVPWFSQRYLIDILVKHPNLLMDDFFKLPRSFYFDKRASIDIFFACQKNSNFLLHIINAKESNTFRGYEIEELINGSIEVQQQIYQVEHLKKKHEAYIALVKQITSNTILTDLTFSSATKEIYHSLFEQMGEFSELALFNVMKHLAKSHDHQILAAKCTLIRERFDWSSSSYSFAELSSIFFCSTFDSESLRDSLYRYSNLFCRKYFTAFERLIQDPKALAHISDAELYKLQQQWVLSEDSKVKAIFNENQSLMEKWRIGAQINKLHQGVLVSDYKEQPLLQREPESITKIRSLINTAQEHLTFNNIVFDEGDIAFLTRLAEHTSVLSTHAIDKNIVPGVFWFLIITSAPGILEESLPLDFIARQIEIFINDIKNGKIIDVSWLIKGHKKNEGQTNYEFYSVTEQEQRCFDLLLTQVDINEQPLWEHLLQDQRFMAHVLDNTAHLEHLAVLNWECPTSWVKQLTQEQLINVVLHLFSNYTESTLREKLLDNFLPDVTDLNVFLNKLSTLAVEQQADFYLRLLNNGQLTLVAFLQEHDHIELLRQSKSLQLYVMDYHARQIKSDLFEVIDLYCRQNLTGDALAIFSLLHDSKLEHNMNKLVPNYSEFPYYSYQKMMIQGLSCATIALFIGIAAPQMLLALAVVIAAYSIYEVCVHNTLTEISYQEALSRKNSSQFFKAAPSTVDNIDNVDANYANII